MTTIYFKTQDGYFIAEKKVLESYNKNFFNMVKKTEEKLGNHDVYDLSQYTIIQVCNLIYFLSGNSEKNEKNEINEIAKMGKDLQLFEIIQCDNFEIVRKYIKEYFVEKQESANDDFVNKMKNDFGIVTNYTLEEHVYMWDETQFFGIKTMDEDVITSDSYIEKINRLQNTDKSELTKYSKNKVDAFFDKIKVSKVLMANNFDRKKNIMDIKYIHVRDLDIIVALSMLSYYWSIECYNMQKNFKNLVDGKSVIFIRKMNSESFKFFTVEGLNDYTISDNNLISSKINHDSANSNDNCMKNLIFNESTLFVNMDNYDSLYCAVINK